jgi:hypothetical protein
MTLPGMSAQVNLRVRMASALAEHLARYVHPFGGTLRACGVIARDTASLALVPIWRCPASVTQVGSAWEVIGHDPFGNFP